MKPCLLYLTCADDKEAEKISQALLEKRLAVCIKKFPVSSSFLWKGKIDYAKEILLIMDSIEEKFAETEKEVARLHSYETFVLVSTPITHTTKDIKDWMKKELMVQNIPTFPLNEKLEKKSIKAQQNYQKGKVKNFDSIEQYTKSL